MSLLLYYHPLASYCHKVLIALYENGTPFEPCLVDLADEKARARMQALWPLGGFPVLRDERRGKTVPETSIIIDYLSQHHPGPVALVPADAELALEARLYDRFFDLYVSTPMQKIVGDELRPAGHKDATGVADARATLRRAYDHADAHLVTRTWAAGDAFTLADCAAAPALFYAGMLEPFAATHAHLSAYFERLLARPSFARTLAEAQPYFHMFPFYDLMPARFREWKAS
jgi:glutathione S-transferase